MTHLERILTPSTAVCCLCERELSLRELEEFYRSTDEDLHGEACCRACMEQHLTLCNECSTRYTAQGMCEECITGENRLPG